MVGAIVAAVTQAILSVLAAILVAAVQKPLTWALQMYANTGTIHILLYEPWAQAVLHTTMWVGGSLVVLRVGWEAFNHHLTRVSGGTSEPMELVKGTIRACAGVGAAPWIAVQTIQFSNDLAKALAGSGFGGPGFLLGQFHSLIDPLAGATQLSMSIIFELVALVLGVVFVLLIWMMSMVRTVEALLYGMAGPILAVGWVTEGGGTFSTWWSGLVGLGMTQCVQMVMLYVAGAVVAGGMGSFGDVALAPFLLVASLWVAYKAPDFVQRFLYHTGAGGALGSAANTAAQVGIRMLVK